MDEALTRIKEKLHDTFPDLSAEELAFAVLLHKGRTTVLKCSVVEYKRGFFDREITGFPADTQKGYFQYQNRDIAQLQEVLKKDTDSCIHAFTEIYGHMAAGKARKRICKALQISWLTEEAARSFADHYSPEVKKLLTSSQSAPAQTDADIACRDAATFIKFFYPRLRLIERPSLAVDDELQELTAKQQKIPIPPDKEIKHSLETIADDTYPKGIEYGMVIIGATPYVLEKIGFERVPIVAPYKHLKDIMSPEINTTRERNTHGLTPDMIISAVHALEHPVCVFQSDSAPQRIIAVTDVRDENGKLIIVPIEPNCNVLNYKGVPQIQVNLAASLYGKQIEWKIEQAIADNRILFADKKKSGASLSSQDQFPGREGIDSLFYVNNIARYIKDVNTFIEKENKKNPRYPRLTNFGRNIVYDASPGRNRTHRDTQISAFDVLQSPVDTENGRISEKGWAELTAVLDRYSDKSYETARYLLIKDGVIQDHIALSSNIASATITAPDEQFLTDLQQAAIEHNYQVVFVHNHPSGFVIPSEADKALTTDLESTFKDHFAGHIILDHGSYGLYTKEHNGWAVLEDNRLLTETDYAQKYNLTARTALPPDTAQREVPDITVQGELGLIRLAEYAKSVDGQNGWNTADWVPCCFTDNEHKLTNIHYIEKGAFLAGDYEHISSCLKNAAYLEHANSVYLIATEFDPDLFNSMEQFAADTGMIHDIYHPLPDGGYETSLFNNGVIFDDADLHAVQMEDTRNMENTEIKEAGAKEESRITRFFAECRQLDSADAYAAKYDELMHHCAKGEIAFPDQAKNISLTVEGNEKPVFSNENTPENLARMYQYAVSHDIVVKNMIPTPEDYITFGGKSVVEQWHADLINKQDEGYQKASQQAYFDNFDNNFERISGINSIETIEKAKQRLHEPELPEEDVIRFFAQHPMKAGTRIPPFGVLSENGVNFDIISNAVYLGRKEKERKVDGKTVTEVENEQTVYIGRLDTAGNMKKIPISESLYNTLIKAAQERAKAPELTPEVLKNYREQMRLHENDTRPNRAENFWHNYKALCRTQANNKQDAFRIANAIIKEMPAKEQNKLIKQFERYEKLTGKTYRSRLSEYYEKSVANVPIVNKTPFNEKSLAWNVRSQIQVIDKAGEKIAADTKAVIGDIFNLTVSYTNPFSQNREELTQPLRITSVCKENNKVVLMDAQGLQKYTLEYDKFVSQVKKLELAKELTQKQNQGSVTKAPAAAPRRGNTPQVKKTRPAASQSR